LGQNLVTEWHACHDRRGAIVYRHFEKSSLCSYS
jgi:hypothetical protein